MPAVRIEIIRYTLDEQPGFVELRLIDAWGTEWLFEEKVPVVTLEELDEHSDYPQPGIIACEIIKEWRDAEDREIVTIDTERPWGVPAYDGTTRFDVLPDQLCEY
jgi:hypothetical protein